MIPTSRPPIPTVRAKLDAFPLESLDAFDRNYWMDSFGISGCFRLESVDEIARNTQLSSIGQGFMQLEEELMGLLVSELNDLPEPEGDFIAGEFGHIQ
jgi:hypothetical protein